MQYELSSVELTAMSESSVFEAWTRSVQDYKLRHNESCSIACLHPYRVMTGTLESHCCSTASTLRQRRDKACNAHDHEVTGKRGIWYSLALKQQIRRLKESARVQRTHNAVMPMSDWQTRYSLAL